MDVANCPRCGKLFTRMSSPICEACQKEEDDLFHKVKEYVDENRDKSIIEVSEATGASVKKLMKYLREGRLELTEGMNADKPLRCQQCGKPITTGIYCNACLIELNQSLDALFAERKKSKGAGMHSMQHNEKNDDYKRPGRK